MLKAGYETESTVILLFKNTFSDIGIICIEMNGGIIGAFDFFVLACISQLFS